MPSNDDWPTTKGLVFSVEWFEGGRYSYPNYEVVYSYEVDDTSYSGRFRDYIGMSDDYFHRDDTIEIRYNPQKPGKSYYPLAHSDRSRRLFAFGIGAAAGLIALVFLYLNQHK
jgi:hypothetical protein